MLRADVPGTRIPLKAAFPTHVIPTVLPSLPVGAYKGHRCRFEADTKALVLVGGLGLRHSTKNGALFRVQCSQPILPEEA